MAPADLLWPLEGQREETLRLIDGLTDEQLELLADDGRSVRQLLYHLISRENGVNFAIAAALEGEVLRLSSKGRDELSRAEYEPAPDWDLARIRRELVEARDGLRRTFQSMSDEDLDRQIRWPEWPARTIRSSIPYMLEHEDSHLDQLRRVLEHQEA